MLVAVRSALFNAWFFTLTLALGSYGVGVRLLAPHRAHDLARLWARLALAGLRVLCGIHVAVQGREHLPPDGAALVASQHQSAFDTLVWLTLVPRACYVVKIELGRVPLFGPLLRAGGQIMVDRRAGAAALRRMVADARSAAAKGGTVVIFPEGTRTEPGARVPLQPGIAALAAQVGLPVIPVATDAGLCWGRRAFRKRPGTIHVLIGPPIPSGLPRAALMDRIRAAWDELLGIAPADAKQLPAGAGSDALTAPGATPVAPAA